MHGRDPAVMREALGNRQRVFAMPRHAEMQGLESTEREKAVERRQHGADSVLQKCQLFGERCVVADHNRAPDHVGMAVQIFGDRMEHRVEAEFQRALHAGCRKSVVCDGEHAARTRDFGNHFEINELQQRIARRFDPNHARVGPDRRFQLRALAHVGERERQIRGSTSHPFE